MPGGDRTGPGGFGPRTGRASGFCAGYNVPGYMNFGPRGGGFGHRWGWHHWDRPGWGSGYGWRRWASPGTHFPEPRTEDLKAYAESLEQELEEIRQEIRKLEQDKQQQKNTE